MIPDELPSPPRKASWKRWTLVLACVVVVIAFVLLASAPKPEPVKVWFVRATNELGVRKLVFEGTNGLPRPIVLITLATTGAVHHAKIVTRLHPVYDWPVTLWRREQVSTSV